MLFTGSIRHTEDERLSLSGDDNSVLSISSAREEDSGEYQCRIMVETPVSVTHSLTVTNTFSIQAEPSQAVVSVPLRGQTSLSCRTVGASPEIQWTRDGARFSRTESYRQTSEVTQLVAHTPGLLLTESLAQLQHLDKVHLLPDLGQLHLGQESLLLPGVVVPGGLQDRPEDRLRQVGVTQQLEAEGGTQLELADRLGREPLGR